MSIADKLLALKNIKDNIKNAIIAKGVEVTSSTPFSSYASKIAQITGGTLITKTITENGTYNASSDSADGYSSVTVDVPIGMKTPKSIVTRECISTCKHFSCELDSHITQTNGLLMDNGMYMGGSGCYLTSDETLPLSTADSWEFNIKYTYNGGATYPVICGFTGTTDHKHPSLTFVSNKLVFFLSSTGTGWNLNGNASSLTAAAGTTYYIKAGFSGTEYYLDYNTTGWDDIFTRAFTLQSTTKVHCSVPISFMNIKLNSNYHSSGAIDLRETFVKINGEVYRNYATVQEYLC